MVKLEMWQKRHWLLLHKARLKWEAKNPGKSHPTLDPFETQISRYTCSLCGERKYYRTNGSDKDAPQHHSVGKRFIILCHACWHLKGIYKKHQNAKSFEGLSGCRVCELQLATKRYGKRSQRPPEQEDSLDTERHGQTEPRATDRKPKGVYRSVGLSAGRNGRGNVSGKRPAGRASR